jgi:PAS domain S-box-containing protein
VQIPTPELRQRVAGLVSRAWVRYGVALLVVLAVTLIRLALHPWLGERMGYIFYLPALAGVGWWLGIRVYLSAALLALVIAGLLFIPRVDGAGPGDLLQLTLYILVIATMGLVVWQSQHLESRARQAGREAVAAADRALAESGRRLEAEARLAAFIREVREYAIFSIDPRGKITSWNAGVQRLLGYSREEFLGMPVSALFPDDEEGQAAAERELEEARRVGVAGNDRPMRRRDNTIFWASGLTTAIYDERGGLAGYTKVMRDLTEQRLAEERIRQSEEHFRGIIDSAMDAIITIDEDQKITIFNPAAEKMFHCPASQAMGQPLDRFIPPEHRRAHRGYVDRFGTTGITSRAMGAHQRPLAAMRADGEVFPMEATISHTVVGGKRLYTAIVRDISERLRHEEALRQSEERFRAIIDSATDAILTIDEEQRITLFNPAAEKMFRCPAREALGQSLEKFIPAELRHRHRQHVEHFGQTGVTRRAMGMGEGGGIHQQALPALRADGEVFPMEATISQIMVGGRRLYTAIVRDISGRIRQEQALAAANERFRLMADASPVLIWVADTTKACTWFNQGWLQFTGRSMEQEIGHGWVEGMHPEDVHRCLAVFNEGFDRRESFEMEYRLRRHDGQYRWVLDRGLPYHTAPGVFAGFIGACIDITEAREFREQLARHAAELERSNTDLKDFAYVVSHDLKEPLRGISNYAAFVLEDHGPALPEDGIEKIQTIQRLARRSYDLLDAILAFSRVGREGMSIEEVDINSLFARAIESLRGRIEDEGALVTWEPCAGVAIRCDPDLAVQALTNLISNALKYNESDPKRVELGCAHRGHSGGITIISVRDNGIGIDPRHQEAIFRMFKRLHARDRYGGGTGSGLAIVKRIVERHGGRVWVESVPGEGSTFYLSFAPGTGGPAPTWPGFARALHR